MADTSTRPKKVITQEQRDKMNAGRKRAMEERKKKKEAEKEELKKELAAMEKQKKKDLDKELAALRQQKDAMETKKKTMEHRKEFRSRMRTKSIAEEEPEVKKQVSFQPMSKPDSPLEMEGGNEYENNVVENELEDLSPSPEPEPVEVRQDIDPREEKIFKAQVMALSKGAKPETKKMFKKITNNYDNQLSITENLRAMADDLKKLIKNNVKQIKKNNKVIEKAEVKEEVIEKTLEEVKVEKKYESQLANLMRLR